MSPDWVTAEPFATNLMKDLSSLREVAQMWHNEAIEAQKANVDELAWRIAEFVRFRTELVRLGKEDSTAAARAYGDNNANRKVRSALNDSLSTLARAYEQEMARARAKIAADQYWFVIALSALAGVGFLALCGGIALVRTGLLLPLSRVRQSMLRLAQGNLEPDPDMRRRAVGNRRDGAGNRCFSRRTDGAQPTQSRDATAVGVKRVAAILQLAEGALRHGRGVPLPAAPRRRRQPLHLC